MCRNYSRRTVYFGAFYLIMAFFCHYSTFGQDSAKRTSMPSAEHVSKANLTYKVFAAEGDGYGYDVYADGRILIHQPTIPGQPGISGFRKKSDSAKVAELVIRKLKNKEIPPTVTEDELKKLKVID